MALQPPWGATRGRPRWPIAPAQPYRAHHAIAAAVPGAALAVGPTPAPAAPAPTSDKGLTPQEAGGSKSIAATCPLQSWSPWCWWPGTTVDGDSDPLHRLRHGGRGPLGQVWLPLGRADRLCRFPDTWTASARVGVPLAGAKDCLGLPPLPPHVLSPSLSSSLSPIRLPSIPP